MLEINSLYQDDSASQYSIFCARFAVIVFSHFFPSQLDNPSSIKYQQVHSDKPLSGTGSQVFIYGKEIRAATLC